MKRLHFKIILISLVTILCILILFIVLTRTKVLKKTIMLQISGEENSKLSFMFFYSISNDCNIKSYKIITIDKIKIGVWILEPYKIHENTKHCIFFHGSGKNRCEYAQELCMGVFANRKNMIIMIPDYRGFGDSEGVFDFQKVCYDVDAVFEYFKRTYENKKIYFLAHSLGGAVVLEYLKMLSDSKCNQLNDIKTEKNIQVGDFVANILYKNKPEKVILVAPLISVLETLKHRAGNFCYKNFFMNIFMSNIDKIVGLSPNESIEYITMQNTLFIYGDKDKHVSLKSIKRFNNVAQTIIVKNADHFLLSHKCIHDVICLFIEGNKITEKYLEDIYSYF